MAAIQFFFLKTLFGELSG